MKKDNGVPKDAPPPRTIVCAQASECRTRSSFQRLAPRVVLFNSFTSLNWPSGASHAKRQRTLLRLGRLNFRAGVNLSTS
jgi:hypothetical protein